MICLQKLSFGIKTAGTSAEAFEVPRATRPDVFNAYYTTQLSSVYSHYEDEVNKKRKLRAAPVRAYGTRRAVADDATIESEAASLFNKRRRSAGDDEGGLSDHNFQYWSNCLTAPQRFALLQGIATWTICGNMSANKLCHQSEMIDLLLWQRL